MSLRTVTLEAPGGGEGPRIIRAVLVPARGLMLLQAWAHIPGLGEIEILDTPPLDEALRELEAGDPNTAFRFGGAILAPFANRIRGTLQGDQIEARVDARTIRLPANWGGKAPGAERYAMHGLILDTPVEALQTTGAFAYGRIRAGDFGGRWVGDLDLEITWKLQDGELSLHVAAAAGGEAPVPVGIGWHPYFRLPSGERARARLEIPAARRSLIDNYDQVLPTGLLATVEGTPFDFQDAKPLGELYLDDAFTDLQRRPDGALVVTLVDPPAAYGLQVISDTPNVKAVQVYAPPDRAIVVIEPQFNLADPFGHAWLGRDTGMAWLSPGERVHYDARITLFTPFG